MQFLNYSLDKLVKSLSHEDFKYLIEECGSKNVRLLKQEFEYKFECKNFEYLYEYMNSFERFKEKKIACSKDLKKKNRLLENVSIALQ